MRHGIRRFLQFQHLEINTFAFIRHDEKRIQWARWAPSLVTEKKGKINQVKCKIQEFNCKVKEKFSSR